MMKRLVYTFLGMTVALSLTACGDGNVKQQLGLQRAAPDEFRVVAKPPLSVPPDFALRPPRPGMSDQQNDVVRNQAKAAVFSETVQASPSAPVSSAPVQNVSFSRGEQSLLTRSGADTAQPDIKDVLYHEEYTASVEKREEGFFSRMLNRKTPQEEGEVVVDSTKEADRIRTNKQEGKPINEGEVAEKGESKKSLLDKVFGL